MEEKKNPLDIAEDIIVVGMDSHTTIVQEKLVAVQRKMLKEGMHNGSHGIVIDDKEIQKRANMQAESCYIELNVLTRQKLGELSKGLTSTRLAYEKSEETFKTVLRNLEYFNLVKYNSTTSQNILAIWSCIFFGLFLILADIALALQLVLEGFVFPEPEEGYEITNLMTTSFFDVLRANWQVFLTTFGVAIFTIILKITFDRFIGNPYGDGYVKKLRFARWFRKDQRSKDMEDDIDPEPDLKNIKKYERIKNGTFIGLMILTIIFLFFLAKFRSFSMNIEKVKNEYANEIQLLYNKEEDPVVRKEAKDAYNKKIKEVDEGIQSNREFIFFGTTLLFPIVSAICFSIASSAIENNRKIRHLKKEVKSTKIALEEDQKVYGSMYGELEAWNAEVNYLKIDESVINFKMRLIDLYNYGFTIGNIRPDLFQNIPNLLCTIEKYRDKIVLLRTNQKLKRL